MNISGRSGSVFIITLVIVVILAAAGGIWYWELHKSSPVQSMPSTTPSLATSSEFIIPEWGVEFQVPPSLSDLLYNISNKQDQAAVATFSTNGLDGLASSCSPSVGQGIGSLARFLYSPTGTPSPIYAHIGDYAYAFIEPTGNCAEPGYLPGGNFTITTTTQLYSQDLGELETAIDKTLSSIEATTSTSTASENSATSGWKTYTNQQYGFEIQYPSDLYLVLGDAVASCPSVVDVACIQSSPKDMEFGGALPDGNPDSYVTSGFSFSISVATSSEPFDINNYFNGTEIDHLNSISIGGNPAYRFVLGGDGPPAGDPGVVIPYGGEVYRVDYGSRGNPATQSSSVTLFDEVVSTFRFIK